MPSHRLSRSPWVLFAIVVGALLATQAHLQFADNDLWGRLAGAALWFGSGHFPWTDVLSFTAAGRPWVDHEWLSSVVFYGALRVGGEPGLLILKDLVLAGCAGLVFLVHRKIYRVSGFYAFFALLFLSPMIDLAFASTVRCQVFSFLFFLCFLGWLEKPRTPFALIPLGIVWANLHGGFILGILLLFGYAAAARLENRSPLPFLASSVAILAGTAVANPYGPRYLQFLAKAWTMDRSDIIEWQPLWSRFSWERLAIGAVVLVGAYLAIQRLRERRAQAPALILLGLAVMAVKSYRFKAFLVLGAAAYFPVLISDSAARLPMLSALSKHAERWIDRLVLMIAASSLLVLGSAGSHPLSAPIMPEIFFPVDPIAYLRAAGASGNLLAPFSSGEFAAWALYPKMKVAIDGRFEEVYSLEETRKWLGFFKTPETATPDPAPARRVREDGVSWVIVPDTARGAIRSLGASGLWTLALDQGKYQLYAARGVATPSIPIESTAPTIADYFTPRDLARFTSSDSLSDRSDHPSHRPQ